MLMYIKPFMSSGLLYLNVLDRSIINGKGTGKFVLLMQCFIEIPVFNANSPDPD